MKRSVWLAALAAVFLSAGLLYAARAGKPRPEPESEPAGAAQNIAPGAPGGEAGNAPGAPQAEPQGAPEDASAPHEAAAGQPGQSEGPGQGEEPGQAQEPQGEKRRGGPHGRDGRRMEREQIVPFETALENAGKTDPITLNQPEFITEDQVQLRGFYYKGNADESTIPVIILHKKEGKKEDWQELAQKLAENGIAVLLPDLRGHGESTAAYVEDYSFGDNPPMVRPNRYLASEFSGADWEALRYSDGHFWMRFLVYLHNKKLINLRKLVMIGDGYGACAAGCWLKDDWQASSSKKGQFTRGLLMISPDSDEIFKELGSGKTKAGKIKYKIFVGGLESARLKTAEEIGLQLAKEKDSTPPEERKVPVENCKTERQGTALLKASSFNMPEQILQFVTEECQPETAPAKWQQIKNYE